METQEWNIQCFGKKLGTISAVKDPHQKEIILTLEIKPDPDLEISSSGSANNNYARFIFKAKE